MRPGMPPSSEVTDPCAASAPLVLRPVAEETAMDFTIPPDVQRLLATLDDFIAREIEPLEREHRQFFDHRREHARTDWENGGRPRTRRSRYTVASGTRGTKPSSTSTVTTGATGSPKDPTRSRSAASPASCSAAKRNADNEVLPEEGANVPLRRAAVSIAGGQLRPPHASLVA